MQEILDSSRGRVGDEVADRIAAAIRSGEMKPGAKLPAERTLMQRYAVSRAAVRDAIASLASRGLLQTRPRHRPVVGAPDLATTMTRIGAVVAHLLEDRAGVLNLFETRIFVEAALARQAAQQATPADVAALREALEANRAAIGQGRAFYRTDVAFHAVLYQVPRNPIFPALQQAYVDWLTVHWDRMPRGAELDRANHAGHRTILESIARRDADAAEAAVRAHLSAAWEVVRGTFEG